MTKKRCIRIVFFMAMFCLLLFAAGSRPVRVSAAGTTTSTTTVKKKGLVKENGSYYYYKSNGKKLKKSWKTINGKKYYFKSDGTAATGGYKIKGTVYVFSSKGRLKTGKKSRFLTINGYKYYVDKKGRAQTGWFVVKDKLYYATKTKGRISTKTRTVNGTKIKFNSKSGYAKLSSTEAKLKKETVKVLQNVTTSSMSKSQKLRACWNYLVGGGWNFRYISYSMTSGWQKRCAYDMLTTHTGDCKFWACAFAALAAEIGYDPYVIWGRVPSTSGGTTTHAWVRINGLYYDPEGQWNGWNRGQYGTSSYNANCGVTATYRFKTY